MRQQTSCWKEYVKLRSERKVGWDTPELNARGECVSPRKRQYSEKRESPGFSYGECQRSGYVDGTIVYLTSGREYRVQESYTEVIEKMRKAMA